MLSVSLVLFLVQFYCLSVVYLLFYDKDKSMQIPSKRVLLFEFALYKLSYYEHTMFIAGDHKQWCFSFVIAGKNIINNSLIP